MTTWFRLDLGNGQDAFIPTRHIQDAYLRMAQVLPASAAIFSRYVIEDDNVQMFFNPAAELLAKSFAATPCTKPDAVSHRFGLLAGDPASLRTNFPDQKPN